MSDMITLRARLIGAATAHVVEFTGDAWMPWRDMMPASFNVLARACLNHMAEDAGPHTRDALVQAAIGRALGADPATEGLPTDGLMRLRSAVADYLAAGPVVVERSQGADQRITRADVRAGRVAPHVIENGVTAPAEGRVNTLTLAEHQATIASRGQRALTREEAAALGHPAVEIDEWFGDAAVTSSGIV